MDLAIEGVLAGRQGGHGEVARLVGDRVAAEDLVVVGIHDDHVVRDRFAQDPWAPMDLLRIAQIQPWTIWLDGVGISARR